MGLLTKAPLGTLEGDGRNCGGKSEGVSSEIHDRLSNKGGRRNPAAAGLVPGLAVLFQPGYVAAAWQDLCG
jgi:hypothetical protein